MGSNTAPEENPIPWFDSSSRNTMVDAMVAVEDDPPHQGDGFTGLPHWKMRRSHWKLAFPPAAFLDLAKTSAAKRCSDEDDEDDWRLHVKEKGRIKVYELELNG